VNQRQKLLPINKKEDTGLYNINACFFRLYLKLEMNFPIAALFEDTCMHLRNQSADHLRAYRE